MHTLAAFGARRAHAYKFWRISGEEPGFMRCLVVTVLPPPDPARNRHGVFQRLGLFVQALAGAGHEVEIVHFVPPGETGEEAERLAAVRAAQVWRVVVRVRLLPLDLAPRRLHQTASLPASLRFRADYRPFLGHPGVTVLRELLAAGFGMILAHRLPAMELLSKACGHRAPVFFDLDDVEHLVKRRAAGAAHGLASRMKKRLEVPALAEAERRALRRAALTFICSDHDFERLAAGGFDVSRVVVAANAVDIPECRPPLSRRPVALFLGHYGYAPNVEAAERLISSIWPRIRQQIPDAELLIAGGEPERIPSFREQPEGVTFPGFVDDLDALYDSVRIVCCPLRNGGGTRLKLIEAAARGKPMIATSIAMEGLAFRNGIEAIVRDDDGRLAEACTRLLTDDDRAEAQAKAAYRSVGALHNPQRIRAQIAAAIASVLHLEHGAPSRPDARFPLPPHVMRFVGDRTVSERLALREVRR
jgi:glycosyltransferase involved in cell wall biosynthesis